MCRLSLWTSISALLKSFNSRRIAACQYTYTQSWRSVRVKTDNRYLAATINRHSHYYIKTQPLMTLTSIHIPFNGHFPDWPPWYPVSSHPYSELASTHDWPKIFLPTYYSGLCPTPLTVTAILRILRQKFLQAICPSWQPTNCVKALKVRTTLMATDSNNFYLQYIKGPQITE